MYLADMLQVTGCRVTREMRVQQEYGYDVIESRVNQETRVQHEYGYVDVASNICPSLVQGTAGSGAAKLGQEDEGTRQENPR
jgi:hypothetical protein